MTPQKRMTYSEEAMQAACISVRDDKKSLREAGLLHGVPFSTLRDRLNGRKPYKEVEAALTTDPDNDELLKLQKDLQEVINLTTELIAGPAAGGGQGDGVDSSIAAAADLDTELEDESSSLAAWKVGDKCLALYEGDAQHYEAVIEEVLEDGTCTVTFTDYNNSTICPISQLKSIDYDLKYGAQGAGIGDAKKSKKDLIAEQREYKRKKAQKKAQRMKQMDEEHESEKNKWLDFNIKTFSKTSKGKVKKSIFATPDSVSGKVGVGTCGSGGRPMTSYQHQEKWKK